MLRIAAFVLTAALLGIVQLVVQSPRMLMLDRFWPWGGWVELALLSLYAGFIAGKLGDPKSAPVWRPRIWRLFTVVFFAQLFMGLSGLEIFLMTGELHLPVPALIVAGPLYRGGGYFMLLLFLSTIVLVGPAWCSHLCYIGAWDDLACRAKKCPAPLPGWRASFRIAVVVLTVALSLILRGLGAPPLVAGGLALAFLAGGVLLMLVWSRKTGAMTHCVVWCPISLLSNLLGRLSPFRMRIDDECNDCGLCTRYCRYDALSKSDIQNRRPGLTCTLCGDCISSCKSGSLFYRFPGLSPQNARAVFIVLVTSLHACFLGLARL